MPRINRRKVLADANRDLRPLGVSIMYLADYNEYKMNYIGGKEATAYYTGDLQDAIGTARDYVLRAATKVRANPRGYVDVKADQARGMIGHRVEIPVHYDTYRNPRGGKRHVRVVRGSKRPDRKRARPRRKTRRVVRKVTRVRRNPVRKAPHLWVIEASFPRQSKLWHRFTGIGFSVTGRHKFFHSAAAAKEQARALVTRKLMPGGWAQIRVERFQ